MNFLKIIGICQFFLCIAPLFGQQRVEYNLSDLLDQFAVRYGVTISYQPQVCDRIKIEGVMPSTSLQQLFQLIEEKSAMRVRRIDSVSYYVYKSDVYYRVTGKVTDADTGEPLIGADLMVLNGRSQKSGEFGLYSVRIKAGTYQFMVSYPGYKDRSVTIKADTNLICNISLTPLIYKLKEVLVTGNIRSSTTYSSGGKIEVFLPNDASVASRMGKRNALSILEGMPGVTSGNVGRGDLFVRGGSTGNNGFYIDGAPVYSINHLYGVNSVFNTNAIEKIEMYKGNVPSRYGNYAASITEFFLKNGDMNNHTQELTVGNLMSDIILQGPIKKEQASYIVSLRYAYPKIYSNILPKTNYSKFAFYDAYAKLNLKTKARSRVYLSCFYTRDATSFLHDYLENIDEGKSNLQIFRNVDLEWSSLLFSFRWNKIFSESLFLNTTVYYSQYAYKTQEEQNRYTLNDSTEIAMQGKGTFNSNITDYGFSAYVRWFPNTYHQIRLGAVVSKKDLRPISYIFQRYKLPVVSTYMIAPNDVFSYWVQPTAKPWELSVYGEDEIELGSKCLVTCGLRGNAYLSQNSNVLKILPFLQIRYDLNDKFSIYGGYSSTMQSTRLLPNLNMLYTFASVSWLPIDVKSKPEYDQIFDVSIAYKYSVFKITNSFFFRYKENNTLWNMYQLSTGKLNRDIFYIGKGLSWGTESFIQTELNNYNCQLAYTFGYSKEKASEFYANEWHSASNDIRHCIDISMNRFFLKGKIEVGLIWSFRTGTPYTQVQIRQVLSPNGSLSNVEDYSYRNNARYRNTHYLNVNLNYHFKLTSTIQSTLCGGIYNLYYQRNPYSAEKYYDRAEYPARLIKYREFSIAPIIPYISLTIKL